MYSETLQTGLLSRGSAIAGSSPTEHGLGTKQRSWSFSLSRALGTPASGCGEKRLAAVGPSEQETRWEEMR